MDIIFWLAMAIFYEDRSGNWTSQWAVANTVLARIEESPWPDNPKAVLAQKSQFPWYTNRICSPRWRHLDTLAWQKALHRAKVILVSRKHVRHAYTCFQQGRPSRLPEHRIVKYGPHYYFRCDEQKTNT